MIQLRVLSLGAGVQSSTMALMAKHEELTPMPDCAIFADTGWESAATYRHLDWIESVLPFPVYRVKRAGRDLGQMAVHLAANADTRTAMPPWYVDEPYGMLPKQCTKEFKVRVIQREIRHLIGLQPKQRGPKTPVVEQWIGISMDEASRIKPNELRFVKNRWPLCEKMIDRRACLNWLKAYDYPIPPKSSCIFCPYRSDAQWRETRDKAPEEWARLIDFDEKIRPGFKGMKGNAYLHAQRKPINEVDLRTAEERGQLNLFENECEGLCGV